MKHCTAYVLIILTLCCIIFCVKWHSSSSAQEALDKPRRLKVGLVLSGGGAKGLAHVGAIKVIEEAGIQVDYITGTSMGSIVGALYAMGYNAAQLEQIARTEKFSTLLSTEIPRRTLDIEEKNLYRKFMASFRVQNGKVIIPGGLIEGQQLLAELDRLYLPACGIHDFKNLPIPFLCVATDIVTGEAVRLTSGSLPDAVRASMAVPSVFTPVEIDGRLLVDGGVVRNLPVSDVREMGADIVIAIDVGSPLFTREQLSSMQNILQQTIAFQKVASSDYQRTLCNILIVPDTSGFDATSFDSTDIFIKRGEAAARAHIDELKKLAADLRKVPPDEKKKIPLSIDTVNISRISIDGLNNVSKRLVLGRLSIKAPGTVTPEDLAEAVNRVYGSQFFERVSYNIIPDGDQSALVINVKEKAADMIRVGINYNNDSNASLLLNTTLRNKLISGSRLMVDGRLGKYPALDTSYFIAMGGNPTFEMGIDAGYDSMSVDAYYDNRHIASFDYHDYSAKTEIRVIHSNAVEFGIGVEKDYSDIRTDISDWDLDGNDVESLANYAFFKADTFDRSYYPHKGIQSYLEAKYYTNKLNAKKTNIDYNNFTKYTFETKFYIPLHRRLSLMGAFFLGSENGDDIPYPYNFYLGGLERIDKKVYPFAGLDFTEAGGEKVYVAQAAIQFEPIDHVFFILRANIGDTSYKSISDILDELDEINTMYYGYAFTVGYDSVIGPVEASIMTGNGIDKYQFYANIGFRY